MNGYIDKFLIKDGHSQPRKTQISPHKHYEVTYGAKEKRTPEENMSPELDNEDIKHTQGSVGAML